MERLCCTRKITTTLRLFRKTVAVGFGVGLALVTSVASADGTGMTRLAPSWDALISALHESTNSLMMARERPRSSTREGTTADEQRNRWIALSPHLSLVARDWNGTQLVVGGRRTVTDDVRLSKSSQMVVTRLRLGEARFAPFAQIGLGQWRVDTDLMPVLPREVNLAAQLGGGFEIRTAPWCTLGVELDYTTLYREDTDKSKVTGPHLWGSFVVGRATF